MPAKRKRKTSRKTHQNNALWFVVIFLIILIASVFLGYYFSNRKTEVTAIPEKTVKKTETPEKNRINLSGTWVSENDGAMMEFHTATFTIEFPSVDNAAVISGSFSVKGDTVTFVYGNSSKSCAGIAGKYLIKHSKNRLRFILISDSCRNRTERMKAPWFPL